MKSEKNDRSGQDCPAVFLPVDELPCRSSSLHCQRIDLRASSFADDFCRHRSCLPDHDYKVSFTAGEVLHGTICLPDFVSQSHGTRKPPWRSI